MDSLTSFLTGARDVAVMLAREVSRAAATRDNLARRTRASSRRVRDLRMSVTVKKAAANELGRIPLIGRFVAARKRREAASDAASLDRIIGELETLRAKARKATDDCKELEELASKVRAAAEFAILRPKLTKAMAKDVESAGARASFLRARVARGGNSRMDLVSVSRTIVEIAAEWRLSNERAGTASSTSADKTPTASGSRIYLPIPVAMRHAARRKGAAYDPSAAAGSRMYVPIGANLAPFERMLPLSFRKKVPKLSFPPIPPNAAGQAIWGVFDRDTWDRIRATAYERTGRRCMLCGRQSGAMKSKIFPQDRSKTGPVECHEVWDWRIPPDGGVGIQRLKALLVLCFECHAVFHESYMVRAGDRVGLGDKVKDFIEARRLALTRLTPEELEASVGRDEKRFMAASNVETWIMDLSHLGAQDFMTHETPILLEDNAAGVPPERIAGLSFVTDSGREFAARSAMDLLRDFKEQDFRTSTDAQSTRI